MKHLSKSPTSKKAAFLHSPTNKSFVPESSIIGTRSTSRWDKFVSLKLLLKGRTIRITMGWVGEVQIKNGTREHCAKIKFMHSELNRLIF